MRILKNFLFVIIALALVLAVKWLITANCLNMNFVDYMKDVVWVAVQNVWTAIKSLYRLPV